MMGINHADQNYDLETLENILKLSQKKIKIQTDVIRDLQWRLKNSTQELKPSGSDDKINAHKIEELVLAKKEASSEKLKNFHAGNTLLGQLNGQVK
jgi:hypothetical protein